MVNRILSSAAECAFKAEHRRLETPQGFVRVTGKAVDIFVKDIKIANNIRTVERLKCELLKSVSELFCDIGAEADSETNIRIADDAANVINLTYVLCRRLGIGFDEITDFMKAKLDRAIDEQQSIEKNYGDMSELRERLRDI